MMKDKIFKNKIEEIMNSAMENLRPLIDVDVVVGKPSVEMLKLICQKYNLKPNQVLMVGDT